MRGLAAAGMVACILAAVVLTLALKRAGPDHGSIENHGRLLAMLSVLVLLAFVLGAVA